MYDDVSILFCHYQHVLDPILQVTHDLQPPLFPRKHHYLECMNLIALQKFIICSPFLNFTNTEVTNVSRV